MPSCDASMARRAPCTSSRNHAQHHHRARSTAEYPRTPDRSRDCDHRGAASQRAAHCSRLICAVGSQLRRIHSTAPARDSAGRSGTARPLRLWALPACSIKTVRQPAAMPARASASVSPIIQEARRSSVSSAAASNSSETLSVGAWQGRAPSRPAATDRSRSPGRPPSRGMPCCDHCW